MLPITNLLCQHFKTGVILGLPQPSWDKEELERKKRADKEKIKSGDKELTGYEWQQQQRMLETEIRKQKDIANIAKASGDDILRRQTQSKINALQAKSDEIAANTGIFADDRRKSVSGFHRVKTLDELKNPRNSSIIKLQKEADILIDKFTPCLENVKTGEIVSTTFSKVDSDTLMSLKNWKFDWNSVASSNANVYKLTIEGDDTIQGLVALTDVPSDKAVYVNLTESAPHNIGKNREFYGVGGHLFAIAAQKSYELGYGGFMYMDAKNPNLVKHYSEKLGAVWIGRPHKYRMYIDENAAKKLLEIYTLKGE